jgi:AcrR family transcriptional regulator
VGLREQKKERVREQLMEAAMQLFTKRGFEQTTIDDIANAVGMSRRTFFRYFQTKEDVVIAWRLDDDFEGMDEKFAEALAARAPNEHPLAALKRFMIDVVGRHEVQPRLIDITKKVEQLIARTPAIRARRRDQLGQFAQAVTVALAKQWGLDAERDLLPRLMANCATSIVQSAFDAWTASAGKESIVKLMDQAFDTFETQFAGPAATVKETRHSRKTTSPK